MIPSAHVSVPPVPDSPAAPLAPAVAAETALAAAPDAAISFTRNRRTFDEIEIEAAMLEGDAVVVADPSKTRSASVVPSVRPLTTSGVVAAPDPPVTTAFVPE